MANTSQYVTLVVQGGTPIRLADQLGVPYPTTGQGALVFNNSPTLNSPNIHGPITAETTIGVPVGLVTEPSIYFGAVDNKDGFYSAARNHVNVTVGGTGILDVSGAGIAVTGNIYYNGTLNGAYHSPLTTRGDLYYRDASGPARLPLGGPGEILRSNGTDAVWAVVAGTGSVTSITAGTGLTATPNPITAAGTLALANTAVTAGTYGSDTQSAQFTVDAQGRLTAASSITMAPDNYLPLTGGSLSGPGNLAVGGILTASTITAPAATSLVLNAPTGQRINQRINNVDVVQLQNNAMFPSTTAAVDLGGGSNRWNAVYAVSGTLSGTISAASNDTTVPTTAWVKANAATALALYLPLTGGSLTGPLDGTVASFKVLTLYPDIEPTEGGELRVQTAANGTHNLTIDAYQNTWRAYTIKKSDSSVAGIWTLNLDGSSFDYVIPLKGTSASFKNNGADHGVILGVSGATKGIRIGTDATGGRIEGVDSTFLGSFQPLYLGGSAVTVGAPLTGTSAAFSGNVTTSGSLGVGNGVNVTGSVGASADVVATGQCRGSGGLSAGGNGVYCDKGGQFFAMHFNLQPYFAYGTSGWFGLPKTDNLGTIGNVYGTGTGTGWAIYSYDASQTTVFQCYADYAASDARLKKNITNTEIDALAAVMATPVRKFTWRGEMLTAMQPVRMSEPNHAGDPVEPLPRKKHGDRLEAIGLIAQEVQKHFPEAVSRSAAPKPPNQDPIIPDDMLLLNKQEIIPYLIRAIQQLTTRVQELEDRGGSN